MMRLIMLNLFQIIWCIPVDIYQEKIQMIFKDKILILEMILVRILINI
jgi:hypothetical protein